MAGMMKRGTFAGCLTLVASALSCGGSVHGGDGSAPATVTTYGGALYLALGPNADVTGEFEQIEAVLSSGTSPGSILAQLSDGARECLVSQNPIDASPSDPMFTVQTVSAGAVTVTQGPMAVTLLPNPANGGGPDGSGVVYEPTAAPWLAPDETVTVSADGATVPPFSVSLQLPSVVTLTQPPPSSSWTIDRSVDFPVAWTGGSTGSVTLGIQANGGGTAIDVECTFAAESGGGAFPASLLAYLLPTTPGADGSVDTASVSGYVEDGLQLLVGGRWNISVEAQSSQFSATATIE
jgi:hypothetical protein